MKITFKMNPDDSSRQSMCKALLNMMTDDERKEFLNEIYGRYVDTDSIKVPMGEYIKKTIIANNDIEHITEAVRLMLIAALSNESTKFKRHLVVTAYEEMKKTSNFDDSPFD